MIVLEFYSPRKKYKEATANLTVRYADSIQTGEETSTQEDAICGCTEPGEIVFSWMTFSSGPSNGLLASIILFADQEVELTVSVDFYDLDDKDYSNVPVEVAPYIPYQKYPMKGICGDDLTWTLTEDGKLTILGTGDMYDYDTTYQSDKNSPFKDSTEIKSVVIEAGVTSIGACAFSGCTGLTDVTIPASVARFGYHAFDDCNGLENVYITDVAAWCGGQFNGYGANPLQYATNLYLNGTMVPDLIVPEGVLNISDHAFEMYDGLMSIRFPTSLTSIGQAAFAGCDGLIEVMIPGSVKTIGEDVFQGCRNLKSVTFENGLESIGGHAFQYCTKLSSLTFPDSVTTIGDYAFSTCTSVKTIKIGKGLKELGAFAFSGAGNKGDYERSVDLVSIEVDPANPVFHSDCNCLIETAGKTLVRGCNTSVIPQDGSVMEIEFGAFEDCGGLLNVTIPEGISVVMPYVFQRCFGLTEVTIPNGVTTIGEGSFLGCSALKSVTIPVSVESIEYAFYQCSALKDVYYEGSEAQWKQIQIPGEDLDNVTVHFNTNPGSHVHTWDSGTIASPATCSDPGVMIYVCGACGETKTEPIPTVPHAFEHVAIPSTCKTEGVEYDVCANCDAKENYKTLPLADHTFGDGQITTAPTCTTEGVKTFICTVCGETKTETIPKTEHNWEHRTAEATCRAAGSEYDVCVVCGEKQNAVETPAKGHSFSAWMISVLPTYRADGETSRECAVCGERETKPIPKLVISTTVTDKDTGISASFTETTYESAVELSVTPVFDGAQFQLLSKEKGNVKFELFDVSTVVDGSAAQPNGSVLMRIPIPADYNRDKLSVIYVTNTGTLETMPSWIDGDYICFETTHFSYYALVDETEEATAGLRGDANLDGKVVANDARLVLRASAKLETLTGQAFVNCDLNGDGKLLAGEARKILRYSAKLETEI